VSWLENGVPCHQHTAAPARLIAALAARAAGPDGEIPGLAVTRPSLEDIYLRLIGAAPDSPRAEEESA
jgi:ABC-2 type transport system ATP-binding protein